MTKVYNFAAAPPAEPQLYMTEKHLVNLAIYGRWTLFPGDDQVGIWTLHFDAVDPLSEEAAREPWRWLHDQLPGMRVRYEDFGTRRRWIWVLTDRMLRRDNGNDLRYAVWPD